MRYKKIASIPCSYANVALSNCLFHTDPDVLLYPMEYYISKIYNIYLYILRSSRGAYRVFPLFPIFPASKIISNHNFSFNFI